MDTNPFTTEFPRTVRHTDVTDVSDLIFPPLYYLLSEHVQRGAVLACETHDFIIIHPDDLPDVESELRDVTIRKLTPAMDILSDEFQERVMQLVKDETSNVHR